MFAMLNIPGVLATIKNAIQNQIQFATKWLYNIKKDTFKVIFKNLEFAFDKVKWAVLAVLITILAVLFKHPLECSTQVFCAILVSIIFVLYIITTVPGIDWIAFGVWFFFRYMVGLIVYTIISGIIFVIISLVFMILALLNFATGGALNKMVLCQTSPLAWYKIPNYHQKNFYERSLFCKKPCASGYAPDRLTGDVCERLPLAQPNFCPQASIMRIFNKDAGMLENGTYGDFKLTPMHITKSPEVKENSYVKFFVERQKYFDTCGSVMKNYNGFASNICANLDAIKASSINGLDAKTINKLQKVCKQGLCNSQSRYMFCSTLDGDASTVKSGDGLLKSISMLVIYIVLFVMLILMTYKLVSTMKFKSFSFGTKKS